MKSLHLFLLVCVVNSIGCQVPPFTQECQTQAYPPDSKFKVPWHFINLDLPPEDRWTELVKTKKNEIKNTIEVVKNFSTAFFKGYLFKLIDEKMGDFTTWFPSPYGDELKGIAGVLNIPLGEIVLFNLFYEVTPFCTSIIAENKAGKLFHARNLDFGMLFGWNSKNHTWLLTEALSKLVVNVEFHKQNQTVFRSVHFAGYVGVLSGVKPNEYTFTLNTKLSLKEKVLGLFKWFFKDKSASFLSFLTRQLLEHATNYKEAFNLLTQAKLVSPVYFILGGNSSDQGCIITRERETVEDIWCLNNSNGTWFILETNYDHWKNPLFIDNRRDPAIKCLSKSGQQNVSFSSLYNVLATKPVLNKMTTCTVLMQVEGGFVETYTQSCADPCWPW